MLEHRLIQGLTEYKLWKCYNGFTLFTQLGSNEIKLINMNGKELHKWEMGYKAGLYAELLPNEHVLYSGKIEDGPLADFEGGGGVIQETDWDGKVVWEYKDPYIHHGFSKMKNGNVLVMKWTEVPSDIAAKVKGGIEGSEKDGKMWGDTIQEIDADGKVVWEWNSHEHLDPEEDDIYPTVERDQWGSLNSVYEMENHNILASFRRICTLAIINKETGKIDWKWGKHEISHQNAATELENNNILFLDNGFHAEGIHHPFSRAVEIDIESKQMVWDYRDKDNDNVAFFSDFMSSAQRLPNGNTLVTDSATGRIFEVTKTGEIIWEYVNPNWIKVEGYGTCNVIPRAFRYGPDYPGLQGNKELRLGKFIQTEMDVIRNEKAKAGDDTSGVESRLAQLGY